MSKTKDENGDGGKTENVDPNVLIAQAITLLAKNQPMRVITEDSPEYQERKRAEGFFDTFAKPVYQNGRECEPRGLSEETRMRASNLKPGKYLSGKVVVEATPNNGIHIKYKSKDITDRMNQPWRDFPDLIDRIWAESSLAAV